MSETLVKTKCGCVIRGGFHTFDYLVHTVEITGNGGGLVDAIDVRADSPDCAIGATRTEFTRRGVNWERWHFEAIGCNQARAYCCAARNPCGICKGRQAAA